MGRWWQTAVVLLPPLLLLLVGTAAGIAAGGTGGDASGGAGRQTVVDPTGRVLDVPVHPRRIVSLAPSITEILYALGQAHRLVGVCRLSNYPPAAQTLPKVGSFVQLDVERIAALWPDLCIGIKNGNPLAAVERLQALSIPVFTVNPVDIETVMEDILAIGGLLDAHSQAATIVADMRRRIDRIERRVATIDQHPRVFVQIGASPIIAAGSGTFLDDLIHMAGGTNVAAGSTPYPRFTQEQVILMAPEVIVILSKEQTTTSEQVRTGWMQWPSIPAVERNAVHVIAPPDLFVRPSPRLVDALEVLTTLIHPGLFEIGP